MRKFILALVMVCATSSLFAIDLELRRASEKALKEKKLLLFTVESENCSYCKQMDADVFSVKRVMKKIEKQYVRIKAVAGREALPNFLNVRYFPTNFILNPKTFDIIDEYAGYIHPKDFVEVLDIVYRQEVKK